MSEPEDISPKERPAVEAAAFDEAESLEVTQTEPVDTVALAEEE